MYRNKYKIIGFIVLSLLGLQASAQTDSTLSTTEQNEKKINELKNKLGSISEEYDTKTTTNQTIVSRLVKMENQLDSMAVILNELREESLQRKEMDKKMDAILNYITEEKAKNTAETSTGGEYYVIVEAQRTEAQINEAKSKFQSHRNEEVIVLKSKVHDYYYLALPQKQSYEKIKIQVESERAAGVAKAWWVAAKNVSTL